MAVGRPINTQDDDKIARVIHKRNVICSQRFLARLNDNHGSAPIAAAPVVDEPPRAPQPLPPIPNKVIAEACITAFPTNRIKAIQKATLQEFHGITIHELLSGRRAASLARARQAAMYVAKKYTSLSFLELGRRFGRDHSTVIHAVARVEDLMKRDPEYAAKIERIVGNLEFSNA